MRVRSSLQTPRKHDWVAANSTDAPMRGYVGYSKLRSPGPDELQYEPATRGGLMSVTGNKCVGDPADESFEARDFNDIPQPIFQQLARDLAARLVRALGGPNQLRAEIKNQRIAFDKLSPELQEALLRTSESRWSTNERDRQQTGLGTPSRLIPAPDRMTLHVLVMSCPHSRTTATASSHTAIQ